MMKLFFFILGICGSFCGCSKLFFSMTRLSAVFTSLSSSLFIPTRMGFVSLSAPHQFYHIMAILTEICQLKLYCYLLAYEINCFFKIILTSWVSQIDASLQNFDVCLGLGVRKWIMSIHRAVFKSVPQHYQIDSYWTLYDAAISWEILL